VDKCCFNATQSRIVDSRGGLHLRGILDKGTFSEIQDLKPIRRRIREYAKVGIKLFIQRLVIYTVAAGLAGAYYDWLTAAVFYVLVMLCEVYDGYTFRSILALRVWRQADVRASLRKIYLGTITSSIAISLFAVSFALQQSSESGHFMPMFILVSASIFATMNNHQFIPVLALRLSIYIAAIIFIPTYDLWVIAPPLSSELWLNFFTIFFVLGFLFELARTFLTGYSAYQKSHLKLEEEHEKTKVAYIAKTQFLATVSHELRTPLTSIKGGLSLVRSGALGDVPEKMRVPFEIAERNSNRLADLVDDLLLLQSIESGRLELMMETVDLGQLVLETIEQFEPFAKSENVVVNTNAKENEFWVKCDAKRIDQVIKNLLSNAAKFSNGQGDITVSIERKHEHIRISIADQGIGIPEGSQDKIFAEFGQIDSSDTRKHKGTGLGLSISKRIIEAHDARMNYTSVLGKGTTFVIEMLSV